MNAELFQEQVSAAELDEYYVYLDVLRENGATNMFGASPYLQEEFDLSKAVAREVLTRWMTSFGECHPDGR